MEKNEQTCSRCQQVKPLEQFSKRGAATARRRVCKACIADHRENGRQKKAARMDGIFNPFEHENWITG